LIADSAGWAGSNRIGRARHPAPAAPLAARSRFQLEAAEINPPPANRHCIRDGDGVGFAIIDRAT